MRWMIAIVVWVLATALLAPVCFFATMLLAGPHSSMLPSFAQSLVVILGWLVLLVTPVWLARAAWRRAGRRAAGAE